MSGYPVEKIIKDKLYKSSLKLFENKEKIEKFLSLKTNQLFDIEDKIYIYDLTNTYFEGNLQDSKSLENIVINLRTRISGAEKRATVVIDADIATEENLQMLTDNKP